MFQHEVATPATLSFTLESSLLADAHIVNLQWVFQGWPERLLELLTASPNAVQCKTFQQREQSIQDRGNSATKANLHGYFPSELHPSEYCEDWEMHERLYPRCEDDTPHQEQSRRQPEFQISLAKTVGTSHMCEQFADSNVLGLQDRSGEFLLVDLDGICRLQS